MSDTPRAGPMVVLDTNIVLDMLLFDDAATQVLRQALDSGPLDWIATTAMRDELVRVLTYPHLLAWAARHGRAPVDVLAAFDALSRNVSEALPAAARCSDADDQKFIDLAVAHQALLLSKDHAVLHLQRALRSMGVEVRSGA